MVQQCIQLRFHMRPTACSAVEDTVWRENAGPEHGMQFSSNPHADKICSDAEAPEVGRGRAGKILIK